MKRRWILWLLVFVSVWVVIVRFAEASKFVSTLATGHWGWVVLAAVLQMIFYALYGQIYNLCFYAVGLRSSLRELLPVVFASVFVNVAIPSGGASGAALFIDDRARTGQSPAKAAAGVVLVLAIDFSAFIVLLGIGMAELALSGKLQVYVIAAAAILVGMVIAMSVALLVGLWRPYVLLHVLEWLQRLANRIGSWIKRPNLLSGDWAPKNAMDFAAASVAIVGDPLRLGKAFAVALSAHFINLASVYVLFLAFYKSVGFGVLVSGYAIGNLFWIVSIAPQGVGVVEGVMTLLFTSLGVPLSVAAVIALAYRGLGFWLPLLVGFILLRRLRSFRETPRGHVPASAAGEGGGSAAE